jgi:YesN/AraC family two-component response regulator
MTEVAAKSILVVDDEPVMREFLVDVLEEFEVETASDGDEAIERIKEKEFDLVITDMKMPRVPGEEVVKFVRETCPQAKIIVISGYSSLFSVTSAVNRGVSAFLIKPFTIKQIRGEIEKSLQSDDGGNGKSGKWRVRHGT